MTYRILTTLAVGLFLLTPSLASEEGWVGAVESTLDSEEVVVADWMVNATEDRIVDIPEFQSGSCANILDCGNCSNTYTCHWCSFDNQCHARGSFHGCSWGATCQDGPPKPKPDKNNTCAGQNTCRECTLSSKFCHWCEHDNACHAVGSQYGCSVGVDCYSNDRCRRTEPETIHKLVIMDIPSWGVAILVGLGAILLACLGCCRYCCFNVQGAYDDLATQGASAPPSVIGGNLMQDAEQFQTNLETHAEESTQQDTQLPQESNVMEARAASYTQPLDEESAGLPSQLLNESATTGPQEPDGEGPVTPAPDSVVEENMDMGEPGLTTPLLPSPTSGRNQVPRIFPTSLRARTVFRFWTCLFYFGLGMVLFLVTCGFVFFPKPPVYDVCNDEMAWKKIITSLATFKVDASFEILVSVSNPNHLDVVLESVSGSFQYQGEDVGTYVIPPVTVKGMAVSDLMLIARVTPTRRQAVKLVEAYYHGDLELEANAAATVKAPAIFDLKYNLQLDKIPVYVCELGPRDLCHCQDWGNGTDHSASWMDELPFLTEG